MVAGLGVTVAREDGAERPAFSMVALRACSRSPVVVAELVGQPHALLILLEQLSAPPRF